MKKLIAIMAMLVFSVGASADTLTLDQNTTSGTIVVNAAIDTAATVTWTADAFDDGAVSPTDLVDIDLGLINPLSSTICADITGNTTGGLGDLSTLSCDDTNNDVHVAAQVDGLVAVGGSNTVDISYTPNLGDFGSLDMCDSSPTLDNSACTQASETGLTDQATFTHYVKIGFPLNANSGGGYTPSATNLYTGDITVDITVN